VCLGKAPPGWLFPAAVALVLGGVIGFTVASARSPSIVLVAGAPTTLHLYRFEPNGPLPELGHGEMVVFDRLVIARITSEVNRLPAFPRPGRDCPSIGSIYQLAFDYSNGDRTTIEIGPPPCGMVTVHGRETVSADAVGSPLLNDVIGLLGPSQSDSGHPKTVGLLGSGLPKFKH
jgi:hypothetical protein